MIIKSSPIFHLILAPSQKTNVVEIVAAQQAHGERISSRRYGKNPVKCSPKTKLICSSPSLLAMLNSFQNIPFSRRSFGMFSFSSPNTD